MCQDIWKKKWLSSQLDSANRRDDEIYGLLGRDAQALVSPILIQAEHSDTRTWRVAAILQHSEPAQPPLLA